MLPCVSVEGLPVAVEGQEVWEKAVASNLGKSLGGRTGQQDPVQTYLRLQ